MAMKELKADGDRLEWWKEHESHLPLLSKVARQVLGIPCSSAKCERVFPTGGFMVTKKRSRLGAARVESLLVVKEDKKLIEEFHIRSSIQVELDVLDVFEASVVIEGSSNLQNKRSATFDDYHGANDIYEDFSDNKFVVTYDIRQTNC